MKRLISILLLCTSPAAIYAQESGTTIETDLLDGAYQAPSEPMLRFIRHWQQTVPAADRDTLDAAEASVYDLYRTLYHADTLRAHAINGRQVTSYCIAPEMSISYKILRHDKFRTYLDIRFGNPSYPDSIPENEACKLYKLVNDPPILRIDPFRPRLDAPADKVLYFTDHYLQILDRFLDNSSDDYEEWGRAHFLYRSIPYCMMEWGYEPDYLFRTGFVLLDESLAQAVVHLYATDHLIYTVQLERREPQTWYISDIRKTGFWLG